MNWCTVIVITCVNNRLFQQQGDGQPAISATGKEQGIKINTQQ